MLNSIKNIIPLSLLNMIRRARARWIYGQYLGMSRQQIFQHIYKNQVWGRSPQADSFHSGTGSRDDQVVRPYIDALSAWLRQLPLKPSILDLGCGDFFVGSQLRAHCNSYIACDIVPELIEHHRSKYASLNVEFKCLDLAQEELPDAQIVVVRQVLQHLDNKSIALFCKGLKPSHQYLVLTEHIPRNSSFAANRDKPAGPDTRIGLNSGVVLTQAPFFLKIKNQFNLCEIEENGGVIQTLVYELN